MIDPTDLRADLEVQPNDVLMRIVVMCKEILHTRTGRVHQYDQTAVLHVGQPAHFPYPYPKVFLLTDADRPFPNEWLEVRTGLYFPTDLKG